MVVGLDDLGSALKNTVLSIGKTCTSILRTRIALRAAAVKGWEPTQS